MGSGASKAVIQQGDGRSLEDPHTQLYKRPSNVTDSTGRGAPAPAPAPAPALAPALEKAFPSLMESGLDFEAKVARVRETFIEAKGADPAELAASIRRGVPVQELCRFARRHRGLTVAEIKTKTVDPFTAKTGKRFCESFGTSSQLGR